MIKQGVVSSMDSKGVRVFFESEAVISEPLNMIAGQPEIEVGDNVVVGFEQDNYLGGIILGKVV